MIESIKPKYLIAGSFLIGLLVGYVDSIKYVFSLSRVFVYFPFFVIGYYLSEGKLREFLNKRLRLYAITTMIVILIPLLYYGANLKPVANILYAGSPYASSLGDMAAYGFLIRLIWYILALILSISFLLLVPRCQLFLSKYGSRTMQIYMTHIWFRNALLYGGFFYALKEEPEYMSYLVLFGCVFLAFVLANKYLEKLYNFIIELSLKIFKKNMR